MPDAPTSADALLRQRAAAHPGRHVGASERRAAACRLSAILQTGRRRDPLGCRWPALHRFHVRLGTQLPRLQTPRDRGRRGRPGCGWRLPERAGEALVELAELFTSMIPATDWVQFQKNGTDATTTCLTIARAATGRKRCWSHAAPIGAVPWCSPSVLGVTAEDRADLVPYDFNDLDSVRLAAESARRHRSRHEIVGIQTRLWQGSAAAQRRIRRLLREICDREGAALVIDEVEPASGWIWVEAGKTAA